MTFWLYVNCSQVDDWGLCVLGMMGWLKYWKMLHLIIILITSTGS